MPIFLAPLNKRLRIVKVSGDEKTKKHLETLGLTKGTELELLSVELGGAIIRVHDSRLALDKKTAMSISVEPLE